MNIGINTYHFCSANYLTRVVIQIRNRINGKVSTKQELCEIRKGQSVILATESLIADAYCPAHHVLARFPDHKASWSQYSLYRRSRWVNQVQKEFTAQSWHADLEFTLRETKIKNVILTGRQNSTNPEAILVSGLSQRKEIQISYPESYTNKLDNHFS